MAHKPDTTPGCVTPLSLLVFEGERQVPLSVGDARCITHRHSTRPSLTTTGLGRRPPGLARH